MKAKEIYLGSRTDAMTSVILFCNLEQEISDNALFLLGLQNWDEYSRVERTLLAEVHFPHVSIGPVQPHALGLLPEG